MLPGLEALASSTSAPGPTAGAGVNAGVAADLGAGLADDAGASGAGVTVRPGASVHGALTALTEALAELATLTVEPNAIEPNASEPRTVDPEVVQPDASESGSAGPDTDGIHSSTGPGNQEGSCQPSGREVDPWAAVDVLELARENRLERLGCIRRLEAHLAAIKTLTLAECISIDDALTPPIRHPPMRRRGRCLWSRKSVGS